MQINELKDRLFNILNDTENSFMADIITNDAWAVSSGGRIVPCGKTCCPAGEEYRTGTGRKADSHYPYSGRVRGVP